MEHFKVIESSRGMRGIPTRGRNGTPAVSVTGGGVAIVYNEEHFTVEEADVEVPEGIEAVWAILTPKNPEIETVKKVLVGGIYISPRSQYKQQTVEHIIETMHSVQSQHEDPVRFIIGGDFNKVDIEDILESNGALQQVCSVATRNQRTLELVITCMATMLHPPTTLDPLNQDENTTGKPSDHNVVVVAPKTDITFKRERHKKTIHLRPLPKSKVAEFMRDIGSHDWPEVHGTEEAHEKAQLFHQTILQRLNKHFPMKKVKMTSMDKKWFNPTLKITYNEMQNEYFKRGKSLKWKRLKTKFRSAKRKASKEFYSKFVNELKSTQPGRYFQMAKRVGAIDQSMRGELKIECLNGLDPQEQVQRVAESFAAVSNEYDPVDLAKLPAYLPAEPAPQLEVFQVWQKIQSQKKTRSTLETDIPFTLRKEGALFLAEPLTDTYNACLKQGIFPRVWKQETVTPVPKKKSPPKVLKDVRKIASTSDYSKIFEYFLLKWILEDIEANLSKRQYGGRKGVGTEHLLVTLVDRIRLLQDDPENTAVVLSSYDWKGAFDRLDPTNVISKVILVGVRASIVNVIIDYLNQRKMKVKMNGKESTILGLVGGGPQGSLIGQLLYIIASNDVIESVPEELKFKYIDDLSVLEAVSHKQSLIDYDVVQHVPSDVATEERFLPAEAFHTQRINEEISDWTDASKMKLNEEKSNYMILSNCNEQFATRITLNSKKLDRVKEICHLGLWITEDLKWAKHISETCKRCYARIKMLSKLKYAGVPTEDLIEIYSLFIRSIAEYCSTVFHSSLSQKLANKLESIQRTCLRVILGEMYVSYEAALEMCGLVTLAERRENRSLSFAQKCVKHPTNHLMFPPNPSTDTHDVRSREAYMVNKARTEAYRKSTIPDLQRRLNEAEARRREAGREGVPEAEGG
jgi:hypothetical protein